MFSPDDGPIRVEPSAGMRGLAAFHRQVYLAYTEQGFTSEQAMAFVLTWLELGYTSDQEE